MHALKTCGSVWEGIIRTSSVIGRTIFFIKTARQQPVRCPGVWCDLSISAGSVHVRTGPAGYEKHWRFPCRAHTTPARASTWSPAYYSVKLYKWTAVSSCAGPVAWCDHENSTGVKIPTGVSLGPTWARNHTGANIVRRPWLEQKEVLNRSIKWSCLIDI